MGGLGNQMFQYAFGCRVEVESRQRVRFDLSSGFRGDRYGRRPALDKFNTKIEPAPENEIPAGMSWQSPWHLAAKLAWQAMPVPLKRVTYERKPFRFDPDILSSQRGRTYYFGYWQSPDYFSSLRPRLLQDFSLATSCSPQVTGLASEMRQRRSICVHVRLYRDRDAQGKLIREAQSRHGTCSVEYYQQGVRRIGLSEETTCYVFADDPRAARSALKLPCPCRWVSDVCPCSDAEELLLMAACRHHVISNSSFGWWGAWLGNSPGKTVVAPSRWLAETAPGPRNCPSEWIRI